MNIQWYPGHMTKTKRMIAKDISLVDIIIELVDARIPYSSKNPDLEDLSQNKCKIMVFNKCDLADEKKTKLWSSYYENKNYKVVLSDSISGKGISKITPLTKELMKEKIEAKKKRGIVNVTMRAMVCGIPNVGKSTFINKFIGRASTKTADKPGVTRGKQWLRINKDLELMDTPGILWPKFDDETVGLNLAFTGAINDTIVDSVLLGQKFIDHINEIYPDVLKKRYGIDFDEKEEAINILYKIGEARGFKMKGGKIDILRASVILFDEFRSGKLGCLTLEVPEAILPIK